MINNNIKKNKPRLAIIGAGASGLVSAWLLENDFDIVIYEKNNDPGGHVKTIQVNTGKTTVSIDTGFEFFSYQMCPYFKKLLSILKVKTSKFYLTYTFYTSKGREILSLPLIRNGKISWNLFYPKNILLLLQFAYFIYKGKKFIRSRDKKITVKEFTNNLWVSNYFKNFIYKLLSAGWGILPDEFKELSAWDVLNWSVKNRFNGISASQFREIENGASNYIKAIVKELKTSQLKLATKITDIEFVNNQYIVHQENNEMESFDHLIIATNPIELKYLLKNLNFSDLENIKRSVDNNEFILTKIAVHSDEKYMPKNKKAWSVANIRFSEFSNLTIYKSWKSEIPIFRSWITHEKELPDKLYKIIQFTHIMPTVNYFEFQKNIKSIQGNNKLYFAGMYTNDIDSHESAIISAINIANKLGPHSERLNILKKI